MYLLITLTHLCSSPTNQGAYGVRHNFCTRFYNCTLSYGVSNKKFFIYNNYRNIVYIQVLVKTFVGNYFFYIMKCATAITV